MNLFTNFRTNDLWFGGITLVIGFAIDGLFGMGHFLSFGIAIITSYNILKPYKNKIVRSIIFSCTFIVVLWIASIKISIYQGVKAYENKEYSKAAKLYEEAGKFNPSDYTHFENSGVSHYLANNLDESLYFLNFVIDSLNPGTGKAEFVAANVFVKKNNKKQACKYANLARISNYPGSYQFISTYCVDSL